MRRLSVSLLAISFFIITLCSCKSIEPVSPVIQFKGNAVINVGDSKAYATVSVIDSENMAMCIRLSEDTGVLYQLSDFEMTIAYDDLVCRASGDYLPSYTSVSVFFDTIRSLYSSEPVLIGSTDSQFVYKGESTAGQYLLTVDKQTGHILSIRPQYADVELHFDNIVTS